MALTKRQRQILDYVQSFIEAYGYSPSFEEIAEHFGYSSLATVHEHLSNLEQKGFLRKNYNKSRSLEVVPAEMGTLAVELPLLGSVAAGLPIEALRDNEDTVAVPHDMVPKGNNYVLRVKGSSMVDEQIRDGDYIIVNSRVTADNGEMVVALVGGESATVKKFYRERDGRIRLQPANPTMQPMYFQPDEVQIQGIVVGVIRKY
ncbi:MAG: transcriptional repressor LexA [Longimicrobiaceae bacterium]|jgi:repressor LexA|nr:transcriptional repressor LexA [Longimicrobiaceae bacterium]